jgi:hypothetical protein
MHTLLDLERYPLDQLESPLGLVMVERCRQTLARQGMFDLPGLLRPEAIRRSLAHARPMLASASFTHSRTHNVYFEDSVPGLAADHPALGKLQTTNHTLCADQIQGSVLCEVYAWPPLAEFLAQVMDKPALYPMADPLASVNVMEYRDCESALDWHFDRSEFTITLLLQAAESGGAFQYRAEVRAPHDPNYDAVAQVLAGQDPAVRTLVITAGTLTVFRGTNTLHRVTPVSGCSRIVATLSYYETPGVRFSGAEQRGFYGREA